MNQRDRIALAMMQPDMEPVPQGLETGPVNGAMPLSPEDMAMIEMAMGPGGGKVGYDEWETLPQDPNAFRIDSGQRPPLPPTIAGEQVPDWFTQGPRAPITFTRGNEEDT